MVTIYIPLGDDEFGTLRPVQAEHREGDVYHITTPRPGSEVWPLGECAVRCRTQRLKGDGHDSIIAVEGR